MKKLTSLLIAMVLILTLSVTAFADTTWYNAAGQVDPGGCYTHEYFPNGGTAVAFDGSVHEIPAGATVIRQFKEYDRTIECGFWIIESTIITPSFEGEFEPSPWAVTEVADAIAKGFVPTSLQKNYTMAITRAEFAELAIQWLISNNVQLNDLYIANMGADWFNTSNPFTDTDNIQCKIAYGLGIVSGIGNNLFDPDGEITREQAATMLMRTCAVIGYDTTNIVDAEFTDTNISDWAINAINFCKANNIMSGTSTNVFSAKSTFTIEQAIVTFNRIQID